MGRILLLALGLAGCYQPIEGDCRVSCADGVACPSHLSCIDGMCRVAGATGSCISGAVDAPRPDAAAPADAPTDGAVDAPADALVDAPVDALVDATVDATVDASVDAFACPPAPVGCGGSPVIIDGHCFVLCTTPLVWDDARLLCGGAWRLAEFPVDGTALPVVAQLLTVPAATAFVWIGLRQADNQPAVDTGWTWASGPAPTYDGWWSIEPDDRGGGEDNAENCAIINAIQGTTAQRAAWADVACANTFVSLCAGP